MFHLLSEILAHNFLPIFMVNERLAATSRLTLLIESEMSWQLLDGLP